MVSIPNRYELFLRCRIETLVNKALPGQQITVTVLDESRHVYVHPSLTVISHNGQK